MPDGGDGNTENGFVQVTGDMVDGMDVVADLDGDTGKTESHTIYSMPSAAMLN
jgi:hypothetical protein